MLICLRFVVLSPTVLVMDQQHSMFRTFVVNLFVVGMMVAVWTPVVRSQHSELMNKSHTHSITDPGHAHTMTVSTTTELLLMVPPTEETLFLREQLTL